MKSRIANHTKIRLRFSRPGSPPRKPISKAFGTGIGAALGWQDMEIRRKRSGEPFVVLHGKGEQLFAARGAKRLLVSLSHTANYAAATAVLEA